MNESPPAPRGVVDSLRALADGVLASVHQRVALLGLEVEEEKLRLVYTLAWLSAAVVAGALALAMATFALVCLFWDTARTAVVIGLSVFHGALFAGVVLGLRRSLTRQPRPLAATLEELEEDRRCIRADN